MFVVFLLTLFKSKSAPLLIHFVLYFSSRCLLASDNVMCFGVILEAFWEILRTR